MLFFLIEGDVGDLCDPPRCFFLIDGPSSLNTQLNVHRKCIKVFTLHPSPHPSLFWLLPTLSSLDFPLAHDENFKRCVYFYVFSPPVSHQLSFSFSVIVPFFCCSLRNRPPLGHTDQVISPVPAPHLEPTSPRPPGLVRPRFPFSSRTKASTLRPKKGWMLGDAGPFFCQFLLPPTFLFSCRPPTILATISVLFRFPAPFFFFPHHLSLSS